MDCNHFFPLITLIDFCCQLYGSIRCTQFWVISTLESNVHCVIVMITLLIVYIYIYIYIYI